MKTTNNKSRTYNSKINIASSLMYYLLTLIFKFLIRTVIVHSLGENYLGLSSLFTSVLMMLNMAELGFSGAIVFEMYEPLAKNDVDTVNALLNYYKKVYSFIGLFILLTGSFISPFIPQIIKSDIPNELNIYVLYFLYLINTSLSYLLFAYKTSLLEALQKVNIVKIIYTGVEIIQYVFQIGALTYYKNYYMFVAIQVFATILKNIIINEYTKKEYPYLKCCGKLAEEKKKSLFSKIKGLIIEKICAVINDSFSNIIISAYLGLIPLAIYGNYYTIMSSVSSVVALFRGSMQASVGNSVATETKEKNYNDILLWQFLFSIIAIVCSSCMLNLYQRFMMLWMGKSRLLSIFDVILICVWFFINSTQHAFYLYLSGSGIWLKLKSIYLANSVTNIILNIVFVSKWGVTGIILVNLISSLLFGTIAQCYVIFKEYFKVSPIDYYKKQLVYFVSGLIICLISYVLTCFVKADGIAGLIICLFVGLLSTLVLIVLFFYNYSMFKKGTDFVLKAIKSK